MSATVRICLAATPEAAPLEFVTMLENIARSLEAVGYQVLHFNSDPAATADEVAEHNFECIRNCTFVLAILDERSTGIGMQFAVAKTDFNKPILAVYAKSISKLAMGVLERWHREDSSRYCLKRYSGLREIVDIHVPLFVENLDVPDITQLTLGQALMPLAS